MTDTVTIRREPIEVGANGMTDEQRHEFWRKEEAEFEASFSHLKASEHHTRCRDCGVFVKKSRWVKKDSHDSINRQKRPLCGPCWSEYDYEY